jgi:ABC-type lipoprotein release transport system permease subunit
MNRMIDVTMAIRNIWRNPRRTVLTLAAIAFACLCLVFMLSFQFGCYDAMINSSVKINTGHLQVQADGYLAERDIRDAVTDTAVVSAVLNRTPGIEAWSFRANAFSLVSSSNRTMGVLVTGIDPDREKKVSTLASLVRDGSYLDSGAPMGAMIGDRLARNLGVKPGDELTVLGQGMDGSVAASVLTVRGIFSSGLEEMDRNVLVMPLADFQSVYSMGDAVHEAVVTVSSLRDVAGVKRSLIRQLAGKGHLRVYDWMEILPGLLQGIQMDLVSGMIMYLILVIVVAFSIFNTFLMAILERTREFGVMMALGASPGRLMKIVLFESTAMTLIGIGLGMVLGSLVTLYFQKHGIYIEGTGDILKQYGIPDRLYPKLSPVTLFAGPTVVFVITFVSSIVPALKMRRMKLTDALNA